jgi:hypothetical protein
MGLLDDITTGLVPKEIDVVQFAESSEFCNKALFPRQAVLLKLMFLEEMTGAEEDILSEWIESSNHGGEVLISPDIRERRDYLRGRGYKHFREVQLVGGRRSSKGFLTSIAMSKVMWYTLQLGDPHEHYGIDKGKEIYFSCVAASESQAKEFQYGDFVSTIETCKAFEPYLQKSLETEFRVATPYDLRRISAAKARSGKIERDTSKLRGKALAANAGTLRGSATMCVAMDEMAHMTVGESKASASEVYGAAIPSLSQFGIDSLIFCNSSPYTKVGKFYEIFEVAMRRFDPKREIALSSVGTTGVSENGEVDMTVNGDPRLFSFEYPSWALFEGYMKHKSRWKPRPRGRELGQMPTASPDWDPDEKDAEGDPLYSEQDQEFIVSQRNTESADPEVFKVEQRGRFAEVVDSFLIPSLVDRMYKGIPKGFDYDDNGNQRDIYTPLYTNFGSGALNTYRYKFHLDPSSTTAGFGFAIAHIEHFVNPHSGDEEEHCVIDMVKRWDPKNFPGRVIRWKPILEEVSMYADIFRPYEITMDQHQSAEPIQTLQEMLRGRNITCAVYEQVATNEKNWKGWQVLKTAIYQGLVHAPFDEGNWNDPTSQNELKFLQEMPTGGKFPKVEKQDIGPVRTKDQADCIREVVHGLIGNILATRARERLSQPAAFGGQGGYGIGQSPSPMYSAGGGPVGISEYYSNREQKIAARGERGMLGMDRANLTRSAMGGRGRSRGGGSRGRGY